MSLPPGTSKVIAYRCTPPRSSILPNGSLIAFGPTICGTVLNYSASLNFSGQVVIQSAKARQNISLIFAQWKFPQNLHSYKVLSITAWVGRFKILQDAKPDRILLKSTRRHFAKQVMRRSTNQNCKERRSVFKRELLWPRWLKVSLGFYIIWRTNLPNPAHLHSTLLALVSSVTSL